MSLKFLHLWLVMEWQAYNLANMVKQNFMKSICLILSLIICWHFVCNDGYPDEAKIICDRSSCNVFVLENNLQINFSRSIYHYFHRRSTIGIFCTIKNNTTDTLLLNRHDFSIISSKQLYQPTPFGIIDKFKLIKFPSLMKISPNSFVDYVLSYRSQNKMPYNDYRHLIKNDTAIFKYINDKKEEQMLGMLIEK